MKNGKGKSALDVANEFYGAVKAGDRAVYRQTLAARYRGELWEGRITPAERWWYVGRTFARSFGMRWRFDSVAETGGRCVNLFYVREDDRGARWGGPLRIRLIWEDEVWRVDAASC